MEVMDCLREKQRCNHRRQLRREHCSTVFEYSSRKSEVCVLASIPRTKELSRWMIAGDACQEFLSGRPLLHSGQQCADARPVSAPLHQCSEGHESSPKGFGGEDDFVKRLMHAEKRRSDAVQRRR